MNWSHSGGLLSAVGCCGLLRRSLVVTDASFEVWLACGVAGGSLALANALQPTRRESQNRSRRLFSFSFRTQQGRRSRFKSGKTLLPEIES